jgi:hypothetical protein
MAEGWGPTAANSALNTLVAAYPWVKLHVGAPGSAGTSNAATETTRKQVTWGSASGGAVASSAQIQWTNVAGSEDYTHATFWTASTAGTFGFSGTVTASAVTVADTFTVASGDVDVALTLAS